MVTAYDREPKEMGFISSKLDISNKQIISLC